MPAKKPLTKPAKKAAARPAASASKAPSARMTLAQVMRILEKAGSEQTRKTYVRHGARGPMFGVRFGDLFTLMKRIDVDHALSSRCSRGRRAP